MRKQNRLAKFTVANKIKLRKLRLFGRCVAQLGSALRWGRRGRRFESYHTDQLTYYPPRLLSSISKLQTRLLSSISKLHISPSW